MKTNSETTKFDKEAYQKKALSELYPKTGSRVGCQDGFKRQTLILEEELIKKLKHEAVRREVSISSLAGDLIENGLKNKSIA